MYCHAHHYQPHKSGTVTMAVDLSQETVRKIQNTLNIIRNKAPQTTWPNLDVNGNWEPDTIAAVRKFQEYAHIKVDGIPGPKTWESLRTYSSSNSFLSAAPEGYTLAQQPIQDDLLTSSGDNAFEYIARRIVAPFNSYLKNISDEAVRQMGKLNKPVTKINDGDINRIVRAIFNKPDVNKMRDQFDQEIKDWVKKTAHGNTNAINYRHDVKTIHKVQEIAEAQRMLQKSKLLGDKVFFDSKTINARNQKLFNEVFDKCMKELSQANFAQKISKALNKLPKAPKGIKINGAGVLGVLAALPIIVDLIKLGYAICTDKPTDALIKKLVADLIEFIVGTLIFLIVSAVVAIFATGGVAIAIVVIVVVIISLILACILPEDFYSKSAEKIIDGVKSLINSIIHSPALMANQVSLV